MNLQQAYYEQKFENEYLRMKGNAFQDFFVKLMELAYRGDFMPCRPWGNRGDRKNDGFLKSERRLFQVYAPNEMVEVKAIAKIREDFEGAREHWHDHFDKWVFVHNATNGLPPHVQQVLLELSAQSPEIALETWGMEELRVIFRRLTLDDMKLWFGNAPTSETKAKLGFKDLQIVLERLTSTPPPLDQPIKDVPRGKIEANALSESAATLLKEGMAKTPLVEAFFNYWHDPTLGEQIATSFRIQYGKLREELTPNKIFHALQAWAGGEQRGTPEHELAVLTIIAYYFERCDIFEEPRGCLP